MARTKTVEIEGRSYTLSSLTMDQVEEFWDDPDVDIKSLRARAWRNILYSLHNAGSSITKEELKSYVTLDGFNKLQTFVYEVSYLQVEPEGENQAVTDQTSSTSVAA